MGTRVFDYLGSTVLFDADALASGFAGIGDARLQREMELYREFVDSNLDSLQEEISTAPGRFNLVAEGGAVDVALLKQCAWYAHQFVMHDPLYSMAAPRSIGQRPMEQLLGLNSSDGFDREYLVRRLQLLVSLTPMVAADYVKFLPISRLFEPPPELPLMFSATGFSDALPQPLMEWMKRRAQVHEVSVADGSLVGRLPRSGKMMPRRAIGVRFGPADERNMAIYHLLQNEMGPLDPTTGTAWFKSQLPDTPPSQSTFDAWVNQSIHTAARDLVRRVITENLVAQEFRASYMTRSEFTADLLNFDAKADRDISRHTMNTLLSLDVPFAIEADIQTLMQVRVEEGEAFEGLRVELEKQFRAIQLEDDPERARLMAAHAVHELEAVGVTAVAKKVRSLKSKGRLEGAIGVAGLVGSVLTQGWSLLATAGAVLAGAKTTTDYWSGRREHPAYFLWKVRDASLKRRGPLRGLR